MPAEISNLSSDRSSGPIGLLDQGPELPDRYPIRDSKRGRELTCREAPTVRVLIERGFSVSPSRARSYPAGSIFLDGAAQGEPFLDPENEVYNLDHHEGCVRAFTLATCEQAMVLIRKGLDLQSRDWTLYANEPDLDTIFAIWLFLNHLRLRDDELRARVMPLLRLQGAIDAHGLELAELAALPAALQISTEGKIKRLRAPELLLKRGQEWSTTDFLEFTAARLRDLDQLLYSPSELAGSHELDELIRVPIAEHRKAIICRSKAGIYEVEKELLKLHGERVGLIVLQKDLATYSVRQVDAFLSVSLKELYRQLNLLDTASGGLESANRWGGSDDIGGSPRQTGTRLRPTQIAEACRLAFQAMTRWERTQRTAFASLLTILALVPLYLLLLAIWSGSDSTLPALDWLVRHSAATGLAFAVISGLLLSIVARDRGGLFGLRLPTSFHWIFLSPVAALLGALGGSWASLPEQSLFSTAASLVGFAIGAELLFRGVVQGIVLEAYSLSRFRARWGLSMPVAVATLLFVLWSYMPMLPFAEQPGWERPGSLLALGLTLAIARDRYQSLLPPIGLHLIAAVAAAAGAFYL